MGRIAAVAIRVAIPLFLFILAAADAFAKGGDDLGDWRDTRFGKQEGRASVIDHSGNMIITGFRNLADDANDDFWTVKFSPAGSVAWRAFHDHAAGSDQARGVAVDGADNVMVTGSVWNGHNYDIHTIKYDGATGAVIWERTFAGAAGGNDLAAGVAVDSQNNVYVGGMAPNGNVDDDYLILKYRADGQLLWQRSLDGAGHGTDQVADIAVREVGAEAGVSGVAVTGYAWNGTDFDFLTVKYDLNGVKLWEVSHGSSAPEGTRDDRGKYVRIDSSGNVIVTGYVANEIDRDIYSAKYAGATGLLKWERTYAGAFDDEPFGLTIDSSGDAYVTGSTWSVTANNDFYTARLADPAQGTEARLVWESTFRSEDGNDDVATTGVSVDELGDVFVTGYTAGSGNYDIRTIKYKKETGVELWQRKYDGALRLTDRPVGIGLAVTPSPRVLVSGWSDMTTALDGGPAAATGGMATTLENAGKSWGENQWAGYHVKVTSGVNAGKSRRITANTATTLTVGIAFGDPVAPGDTYYLYDQEDYDLLLLAYDPGLLNRPTLLDARAETGKVRLAWKDNSDNESRFIVYRRLPDEEAWSRLGEVGANVTSYEDATVEANRYYLYQVSAYNDTEGESHPSDPAMVLTVVVDYRPPAWGFLYNSPDNMDDRVSAIAAGPDGNPVVTGKSQREMGGFDYYTVKLRAAGGTPLWSDLYDSPDSGLDVPVCLAVDQTNAAIVSGYSELFNGVDRNSNHIFTLKYPDGGPPSAWHGQYIGSSRIDDRAVAVAATVDGSGNSAVTGYGKNASGNEDSYLIRYPAAPDLDGTGNALPAWVATLPDRGGDEVPAAVAFSGAGEVFVAGVSRNIATGRDEIFVAGYSAGGTRRWIDYYNGGYGHDRGGAIALDNGATPALYVTGSTTTSGGTTDIITLKYDPATGARLWGEGKRYAGEGNGDDAGVAVAVSPVDGTVSVSGDVFVSSGDHDVVLIHYSPAGEELLRRSLIRPTGDDLLVGMAMDPDGNVVLAATTAVGGSSDSMALKYDFEGTLVGATLFDGDAHGYDESAAVAINVGGEAFVAGYQTNSAGNADFLVYKPDWQPLLRPAITSATPDHVSVTLAWSNRAAGEHLLRLERKTGSCVGSGTWTPITTLAAGAASYRDQGLNPATAYCWRIRAERANGEHSPWSERDAATIPLAAPGNLAAAPQDTTRVSLSWSDAAVNETGTRVERCTGAGCTDFAQVGNVGPNVTTFTDPAVCNGTGYRYRVVAYGTGWESPPSNEAPATTPSPQAPVLTAQRVNEARVSLSWSDPDSDETGFRVVRCIGAACETIATKLANTTAHTDTTVAPLTTYIYRVSAYKSAGCGWEMTSNDAPVTTSITPPANLIATVVNTTRIDLSWTDTTGSETAFVLERCEGSDCTDFGLLVNLGPNVVAHQDTTVIPGTTYRYRVKGVNGSVPWETDYAVSNPATPPSPVTPSLTAVRGSEVRLDLSWPDLNSDESGFRVERCQGAGCTDFAQLGGDLPSNQWSFGDTTVTPGATYTYRVSVFKSGTNGWTRTSTPAEATASILAPGNPHAVPLDTTRIQISWADTTATETGFVLERCTPAGCSDFGLLPPLGPNVPSYIDSNVCAGTGYSYRLKAVNTTVPWESPYAGPVGTTTPAVPSPPNASILRVSEGEVRLTWPDWAGDETGYRIERCTGSGCTDFQPYGQVGANVTGLTDTGVVPNAVYRYRVRAYKTATCGWESNPTPPVEIATTLIDPSGLTATQSVATSCNDIRVVDADGITPLAHWVESGCGTRTTRVWAKLPSLPTGQRILTLYGANPPVAATADASAVFPFFDDFTGTSIDSSRWNVADNTGFTVSGGFLHGTNTKGWLLSRTSFGPGSILETSAQTQTPVQLSYTGHGIAGLYASYSSSIGWVANNTDLMVNYNGYSDVSRGTPAPSGFLLYRLVFPDSGAITARVYDPASSTLLWDAGEIPFGVITAPVSLGRHFSGSYPNLAYAGDWDWIRVRRYASPEPAVTLGTREFGSFSLEGGSWGMRRPIPVTNGGAALADYQLGLSLNTAGLIAAQITLAWTDSTGTETGFAVERCEGEGCDFSAKVVFAAPPNATSFTDRALRAATTYCYRVKGVNTALGWETNYTGTQCAVTQTPLAPDALTVVLESEARVELAWSDRSSGEDGFIVERCLGSSCTDFAEIGRTEADTPAYTDANVCGGTYRYRVRAFKAGVNGWTTGTGNEAVATTRTPPVPTGLAVSRLSEGGLALVWSDHTADETGYQVERCAGHGCVDFAPVAGLLSADTVSFSDVYRLDANTTYTYRVKAVKTGECGWEAVSGTAEGTTTLTGPSGLAAASEDGPQVRLAWSDTTATETSFILERCAGSGCGDFSPLASIPADITSYLDRDVLPSTSYTYRLKSVNEGIPGGGGSCWSRRLPLTFTGFQPDFQVRLTVPFRTGMKDDFSDIRFYDEGTGRFLPHWVESKTDRGSAVVWLRTGVTGEVTLYFGNPAATPASDFGGTFLFGDDFSTESGGWAATGLQTGVLTVADGRGHLTAPPPQSREVCDYEYGYCWNESDPVDYGVETKGTFTLGSGLVVDVDLNRASGGMNAELILAGAPQILRFLDRKWYECYDEYTCVEHGPFHGVNIDGATAYGTVGPVNGWETVSTTITPTLVQGGYRNDPVQATVSLPGSYSFKLRVHGYADGAGGVYLDNVRVRRYAQTTPSATLGQEESSACYAFAGTWASDTVTASAATAAIRPPEIVLPPVTPNTTQVDLSWGDTTVAESGFVVERCVGVGCEDFTLLTMTQPSVTTYSDTSVCSGQAYRYRVKAVRSGAVAWESSHGTAAEIVLPSVGVPTLTVSAVSTSRLQLSWVDPAADESGFRLERFADGECTTVAETIPLSPNTTGYFFDDLLPSTTHCYRVTVFKNAACGWEKTSTASHATLPVNPTTLNATAEGAFKIRLSWAQTSPDEEGFEVESKTTGGEWVVKHRVSANVTSLVDSVALEPTKTYTYRIRAFRSGDRSTPSNEATATTLAFGTDNSTCH